MSKTEATTFSRCNLGGNWLALELVRADGKHVVWYDKGGAVIGSPCEDAKVLAIWSPDDEEWTEPLMWERCDTMKDVDRLLTAFAKDPDKFEARARADWEVQ